MILKIFCKFFLICLFIGLSSCGKDENKGGTSLPGGKDDTVDSSVPEEQVAPEEPSIKTDSFLEILKKSQQQHIKITLDQMIEAGLLEKENSSVFGYYMQMLLNLIDLYISEIKQKGVRHPEFEELVSLLCPEVSRCSKGLDLTQIKKPMVSRMIQFVSLRIRSELHNNRTPEGEIAMLFLHGYLLSPPQSIGQFSLPESPEKLSFVDTYMNPIRKIGENLKENTKILVNLSYLPIDFDNDFSPFLYLGERIKEKKADLYIIGRCGVYCVSYLLPAARTVYIEPYYGHIVTRGDFEGRLKEGLRTHRAWIIERKKELQAKLPSEKEKVDFVVKQLQELIKSNPSLGKTDSLDHLLKVLSDSDLYGEGGKLYSCYRNLIGMCNQDLRISKKSIGKVL